MKKSYLNIFFVSSLIMLLIVSCKNENKTEPLSPDDQTELKGEEVTAEIIFENDYAKVSMVSLAPGDFQPTHDGEKRLIYSLTDYSIDWEEKGENIGIKTWKKGDAHFHEAGKHSAKNNGTTTAEWLVFSKKNNELPDCGDNTIENDVNSVSPEFAKTLIDNQDFKLTQVTLPEGESIPTHSGINRVIYSLSDYELKYESNTEGTLDKQFKSGEVHWHEACMHALDNTGETDANFLVVSYKK